MTSLVERLPQDLKDSTAFAEMLASLYGADAAQGLVETLQSSGSLSYWVNTLVDARDEPVDELPGQPLTDLPGVYTVVRDAALTTSPAATSGRIYIQNPSSVLAVRKLDPQPGEEVLDLAAAPGGKTIAMAHAMANSGRIAAVEPIRGRFHRLRANLDRCGVTIAELYLRDGRGVGRAVPGRFDRVLLDAPCSSQARMRWDDPASYRHWSRRKVKEASRKQKSLLLSAYAALKPGGRLLYCTCSFAPEENELVVAHLLKRSDASLKPLAAPLPRQALPGLTRWQQRELDPRLALSCRIVPDGVWDGFYMAAVVKP